MSTTTYEFPNGNKFVGTMVKGEFHGEGVLYLASGGAFTGVWEHGVAVSGSYQFEDGLEYEEVEWDYCSAGDRRFHCERVSYIPPAGETLFANVSTTKSKSKSKK